jgi:hypothetical protein
MDTANVLSRRSLLKVSTALAATSALAPIVAAIEARSIGVLIAAHQEAFAAYNEAIDVWSSLQDAFSDREHPRVAISISTNGERLSGYYELGPISADQIRKYIIECHQRLREIHCGRWASSMVPDFVAAVEREVNAAEQRSLDNLDAILAQQEADRAASGIIEADEEVKRRCQAERKEMALLLAHRPANEAESVAKVDYIEAHSERIGESVIDDDGMTPFLLEILNGIAS